MGLYGSGCDLEKALKMQLQSDAAKEGQFVEREQTAGAVRRRRAAIGSLGQIQESKPIWTNRRLLICLHLGFADQQMGQFPNSIHLLIHPGPSGTTHQDQVLPTLEQQIQITSS